MLVHKINDGPVTIAIYRVLMNEVRRQIIRDDSLINSKPNSFYKHNYDLNSFVVYINSMENFIKYILTPSFKIFLQLSNNDNEEINRSHNETCLSIVLF